MRYPNCDVAALHFTANQVAHTLQVTEALGFKILLEALIETMPTLGHKRLLNNRLDSEII